MGLEFSKADRLRTQVVCSIPANARGLFAVASASWVAMLAGLAVASAVSAFGCSGQTRTRVGGAETTASHRVESPGVTRTRSAKLRIQPANQNFNGATTSPPSPAASEPSRGHGLTPAAQPVPPTGHGRPVGPVGFTPDAAPTGPALLPVSWPGGNRDQDTDPIADAVQAAAQRGQIVEYEISETETVPLATSESTLDDRGASLDTASTEAAIGFETSKGGVSLPFSGKSRGSSGGLDADLSGAATNPLVWIGGLVCVAAIVPIVLPPRRIGTAAAIFGLGAAIAALGIVATSSPWVFVLVVILGLVAAGYFGWQIWRNGRAQLALRTVATGIENTPPGQQESIKERIARATPEGLGRAIKAEITAQKNKIKPAASSGT